MSDPACGARTRIRSFWRSRSRLMCLCPRPRGRTCRPRLSVPRMAIGRRPGPTGRTGPRCDLVLPSAPPAATLRCRIVRDRRRASRLPSLPSALRGLDPRHAFPSAWAIIGASTSPASNALADSIVPRTICRSSRVRAAVGETAGVRRRFRQRLECAELTSCGKRSPVRAHVRPARTRR